MPHTASFFPKGGLVQRVTPGRASPALETIELEGRALRSLAALPVLLKDTGFSRLDYEEEELILEKTSATGKGGLDYQIVLGPKSIRFLYSVGGGVDRRRRFIQVLPALLNILTLVEDFYEIKTGPLFQSFLVFFSDLSRHMGKDALELATELDELKAKYAELSKKYDDLVRAGEENTRILLECERRRDELHKRVDQLASLSDEVLKQNLFEWIKVHGGSLETAEFARAHNLAIARVEEGVEMLVREGYIKPRSEE